MIRALRGAGIKLQPSNLGRQYPKTDAEIRVDIQPLKETIVGGVRRSLWVLFGSVSMLLLIACTNIAALLLSRATQRQHEISLRFSLGASRASVVAQLLTESFVLALGGALLGLFVATGASRVFRALAANLPRIAEITLDWRIVLYSLACAVAATLLCGLFPAIRGTRQDLLGSLAQASRTHVSVRNPVQLLLVGVQVALAVTLLAGAGLLLRSQVLLPIRFGHLRTRRQGHVTRPDPERISKYLPPHDRPSRRTQPAKGGRL